MAKISSLNGAQRRVLLDAAAAVGGVLTFHPVSDIYVEYRALRRTVEAYRSFSPLMNAAGMVAKGGGKFTPRYTLLLNGTKLVVPVGVDVVNVTGEVLTDDQTSPWDLSQVTGALTINYQPSEAEVITVATGSGVTAQDKLDIADEVRTELTVELAAMQDCHHILGRKRILDPETGLFTIYTEDGVTPWRTAQTYKDAAGTQIFDGNGQILRTEELG